MKVIDLLNKIANGEIEPNTEFFYKKEKYRHIDSLFGDYYAEEVLNNEVEIIEEDKKIEKIKSLNNVGNCQDIIEFEDKQQLNNHILKDKINEIIDCINRGDKK